MAPPPGRFGTVLVMSPSAEVDGVPVLDAASADSLGERFLPELRVASRAGVAAHVHDRLDARVQEAPDELLERPCAVTDRVDRRQAAANRIG